MFAWLKNIFTAPPKTDLEHSRDNLYDRLDGLPFEERFRLLEGLMSTDPDLYASWLQEPYTR